MSDIRETVIYPRKGISRINLRELIEYRDLLFFLIWRDLKVRYKQTLLGSTWAILQPFIQMVIFSIFFGKFARLPSENIPYPIYVYSGLIPWAFFAASIMACNNAMLNHAGLLRKVYFPRIVIPLSAVGAPLADMFFAFLILAGIMLYYQVLPGAEILTLIPLLIFLVFSTLGIGIFISILSGLYRDFRHIIPFVVQIWFFVTPVIYSPEIVPERFRIFLNINPMAGIVQGFRAAILGLPFHREGFGLSLAVSSAVFAAGLLYFYANERKLSDVI